MSFRRRPRERRPAYAPLDVIGVNEYFGWFDAGAGATDDRDALSPFLDGARARYPKQAAVMSEFGFDANQSRPVEAGRDVLMAPLSHARRRTGGVCGR
jgi:hypothetical protein